MPVRDERIHHDLQAIAACTATPGAGASRPTFSPAWRAALDYVGGELDRAGCRVRVDAAGNLHARPAALPWDAPAWLSGSHLDSVPGGGDFDGVTGVVVPLELLRAAADEGRADLPLELVVFAEEEGTTFGLGMLGSHAWCGSLSPDVLGRVRNAEGRSYLEAGAPHGVDPAALGADGLRPERYLGFVEVHVEQGAALWRGGIPLALVDAIAGRRQYRVRLRGSANHAGSTAMADRRDALAGAAELVLALEALPGGLDPRAVATVGQIAALPNAINVIPGEVELSVDFRATDDALLEEGDRRIAALLSGIAGRRALESELTLSEALPARPMEAALLERLQAAAARAGLGPLPLAASGALHDAAILAPHLPTAMLFVASRDGVSHNPAEYSRVEDIAMAARVLWELVR